MQQSDFSIIYNEHKEMVVALVCRFVYSRQDQEDLFQEVFFKIYRSLPKFREKSSLRTWIYKITTTTAITYVNKKKNYKKITDFFSGLKMVEQNENAREVQNDEDLALLNVLNPQQKMTVILSDIEDKSLEEVSQIMGIPLGTVKSNLHRARERLRKELNKNG